MKILLLAPHPFYQERGTPIAIDLLLGALSRLGHRVDVLTYHEGSDRPYDGVSIHRIPKPCCASGIRPGFTLKKLIADRAMWLHAARMARDGGYDVVHAVEESVFMALRIRRRFGTPYVFDMDSSMPQQVADKVPLLRPLLGFMRRFEARAARNALAVIAVCDSLAELARGQGAPKTFLLRDISLLPEVDAAAPAADLRGELGIDGLLFLYVGNLERYQGIDLMLDSFRQMQARVSSAHLAIVGGSERDVARYRDATRDDPSIHVTGPRPTSMLGSLLRTADVLVSPRTHGGNTPMKIYSYLAAGKAVLATDLPTHTQVLDASVARLAAPEPAAFSEAMVALASDDALRARLGEAAATRARERHSREVFNRTVGEIYGWIGEAVKERR